MHGRVIFRFTGDFPNNYEKTGKFTAIVVLIFFDIVCCCVIRLETTIEITLRFHVIISLSRQ